MALGLSGFIFNLVSKYICNPDNLEPTIKVKNGDIYDYYYDERVADNVPKMLKWLSGLWICIILIAIPFLKKFT